MGTQGRDGDGSHRDDNSLLLQRLICLTTQGPQFDISDCRGERAAESVPVECTQQASCMLA